MGSILHKRGTGVPSAGSLTVGELAIDQSTGKVYTKTTGGQVVEVGGGGGGGGDVGMKLAVQPATAGDFRLAWSSTGLYAGQPGPFYNGRYESTNTFNNTTHSNYTTTTLTVPSGMNFLLQAINSATGPSGSYHVKMDSITIDGDGIYQNADSSANYEGSGWPSSMYGTLNDNKLGALSDMAIIVESSLSFDIKTSSGGAQRALVYGFFIKA